MDDLRFRAQLCGGPATGLVVALEALEEFISVYQNGGAPFAVPMGTQVTEPEIKPLGSYELVGPIGPDRPVYVASQESAISTAQRPGGS